MTTPYLGPDELCPDDSPLAHEVVENNHGTEGLVLVGLLSRGTRWPGAWPSQSASSRAWRSVGALDIGLTATT